MFSIKSATSEDAPLIRKLASQIWSYTYNTILTAEQLEYMFEMMYSEESIIRQMTVDGHCFFIASIDNVPSGYISIEKKSEKLFNFQKIYALPDLHGKGFGRFMVEQAINYLKSNFETPFTVELFVNRNNKAVGFYKHIGFREVGTRDHAIGDGYFMNDYIMNLDL